MNHLPTLGVGLGFRQPYLSDIFLHRSHIDFLEITMDHYLDAPAHKQEELELLRDHFTLIPHGLDLSLGSAEGLDDIYLEKIAKLIDQIQPPWWSEHISFTKAGGISIGHLAPLPRTAEALDVLCQNIAQVKKVISIPLILENITYTVCSPAEIDEPEFLNKLTKNTGCGLLLDITNIYTNSINHKFNAYEFIEKLPLENIVQFHFVGGHWQNDILIDSHSQKTPTAIWELMEEVIKKVPVKGIILERDENLPPFTEILQEIAQARNLGKKYKKWD